MDASNIPDRAPEGNSTVEVARILKNTREHAVVSLSRFNGHDLVDVRVHMLSVDAPTGRPTRKGVALKVGLLPELIAALSTALAEARQRGLMPDQLSAKDRTAAERQRRRRERQRAQSTVTAVTASTVTDRDIEPSLFREDQSAT